MGCNVSRPHAAHPAATLLELAPVMTAGHNNPLPDLDRETLLGALTNVAHYLNSQRANITVISVGGAVNTIFFETRRATHDVDFYNQQLRASDYNLIKLAMQYAQSRDTNLQSEWFNNRTILFIPKTQREYLTQQAFTQDEVVFQRPGLKVLAAPWDYAICAKLDRCAGAGLNQSKPYDYSDAATYLRRYLQIHNLVVVTRSQVYEWASSMYGQSAIDMRT
ncbi:hypothetical protein DM02DRAFT_732656 [Periconia macrospinosa]|uniref:DUF7582 domain-containing protein n=1 Tax=Periconia macrospinosa TaxID=97972 RepID=A0A2V1D827_9PLEO|nr:hypothetical protein DM02DRAFT_732656 [Periconia macrospinosa]